MSGSSAVTAWMSRTRSEMRTAKTRLSTTSSPHWLRIPGCCAADTATGSWCCTQGVLPRWKSRPAARSCKRPQSLQPLLFRLVRNPGGFSWSCEDSQRAEGMHRGHALPQGIRTQRPVVPVTGRDRAAAVDDGVARRSAVSTSPRATCVSRERGALPARRRVHHPLGCAGRTATLRRRRCGRNSGAAEVVGAGVATLVAPIVNGVRPAPAWLSPSASLCCFPKSHQSPRYRVTVPG